MPIRRKRSVRTKPRKTRMLTINKKTKAQFVATPKGFKRAEISKPTKRGTLIYFDKKKKGR